MALPSCPAWEAACRRGGLRTALRVPQGQDMGARGAVATPKAPGQMGGGEGKVGMCSSNSLAGGKTK